MHYLETLGLGGCLADDMGLGKTVQVIAQLLNERAVANNVLPTLLIAPTSVLGNWQKEIERFAPNLRTVLHHGSQRSKDADEFEKNTAQADVVISSYALARRDEKIFCSREWQRLVLDEAQNIKNPKAAQSKSILKFNTQKRLALTGTPVENQATDRAFRIGQEKNAFVHKYIATGTLEERIDQMIEEKKKISEAIVGSDESWLTELDNESIKKLISLSKDAVLE